MSYSMKTADLHEDYSGDLSDSDDVLSFANLPIPGYMYDASGRVSSSSEQDRFEFLNSFGSDHVKNDPFSLWGRTESKSRIDNRPSFKSGSYHKGSRTSSARKSRSSSVRVSGLNHLHSSPFLPAQKEKIEGGEMGSVEKRHSRREQYPVSQAEESRDKALSDREPEKHTWRGSHFANVLARFGCLSA